MTAILLYVPRLGDRWGTRVVALKSIWFSSNPRFQKCLTSDADHIPPGDQGEHVLIIQAALIQIDGLYIDPSELRTQSYGSTTADAVLAYKSARDIVNRAYQSQPDNIVGKMTIARLDADIFEIEHRPRRFNFRPQSKAVVLTESAMPWVRWADQFVKADPNRRSKVTATTNVGSLASTYQMACALAGVGGTLILSVGHGGGSAAGFNTEGILDLAPKRAFRLGGANSVLPGDQPSAKGGKPAQTSCYYDFRVANPILKGGFSKSRLDEDSASNSATAAVRLKNWRTYQDICSAIQGANLAAVVLLTCKMGIASEFMRRISSQFGTMVIGYGRRVAGQEQTNGRARIFLEGDPSGSGTNVPMGEIFFPLAMDMVVISKP